MPTYNSQCPECGITYEYQRSIAEYQLTPACSSCGGATNKVILSAPMGFVTGKFEPFKSQVDGSIITCQHDLKAHNERNNVTNLHEGYDEATIIKGDFGNKKIVPDKKEIKADIAEAIHKVAAGYKPIIGAQDE